MFSNIPNVNCTSTNWLTGWTYRKSHVITNATGAGTNYQIKITVYNTTGTDSGGNVYIGTKARVDFGDIRFTDSTGNILLNYYEEGGATTNTSATFWVQVSGNLSATNQTIYMYYGNSGATSISNETSTFPIFYEDFNSYATGSLDGKNGWAAAGGSGTITVEPNVVYEGTKAARNNGTNDKNDEKATSSYPTDAKIVYCIRAGTVNTKSEMCYPFFDLISSAGAFVTQVGFHSDGQMAYWNGSAYVDFGAVSANTWYRVETQLRSSDHTGRHNLNNGAFTSWKQQYSASWTNIGNVRIDSGGGKDNIFDEIFIAKFVDPEPTQGAWGSEESLGHPTLTVSLDSSTVYVGYKVNISGKLTYPNGTGISGADLLLAYSVTGGETWNEITSAITTAGGEYFAEWMPTATGNYLVRVSWEGNETLYLVGTEVRATLAVTPVEEQYVFSVVSNSTVSELAFNATSRVLSFTVSGPSGTTGYTKVTIAKTLIGDISRLNIYLDGNQMNYTVTSTDDSWLLYFTYHHSTHEVIVSLGPPPFIPPQLITALSIGILAVVLAIIAMILILRMRRGIQPPTLNETLEKKNKTAAI